MRMWTRAVWVGVIALAAGGAGGCAEERAPINRVQPNAMAKSFFVGEDFEDNADDPSFYARMVVADVAYGAAQDGLFTSTYAQNPSVIKWEVTEDLLLGRIVYQRIEGADTHGEGPTDNDGQIAYAFPILSHFDIRRDYNPSTGEESNVIVENTSDRPWDEREYMRVDWSRNLNVDAYDFDTLSLMGIYGGITYEPMSWYVNDPNHPDAPHFAMDEGYFDVTTKALATPGQIDLSHLGWGINSFPACFLPNDLLGGSWPFGNCNPTEITLRLAFRRVEVSDYEPKDWDGNKFSSFGIFYGERHGYARNYGIVDDKWHRFAARYNIWERSHAYEPEEEGGECPAGWVPSADFPGECEVPCYTSDKTPPSGDPNRDCGDSVESCSSVAPDPTNIIGNGTADECELVGNGSQCDQFKQKCTLPLQERTAKPIVWHYTKGSHPDYFVGTEWATHEWDVAMRTAVRFGKYGECVAVYQGAGASLSQAQAECGAKFPVYDGQQEDNENVIALSREVDDCRAAIGAWAERGSGASWSEERVEYCDGQAQTIGEARGYSAGVIAIAQMGEMVTLCHSPVEPTDSPLCVQDIQRLMPEDSKLADKRQVLPADISSAECAKQWDLQSSDPTAVNTETLEICDNGFAARFGDLRYHQVNVITQAQTPSSWGIMVDADDPRTGEKIHGSMNVWSHVTDLATQGHVDIMRYIKGEISTDEVTDGAYVRDWASAAEAAGGKGALGTMDKGQVARRQFAAADGRNFTRAEPMYDVENLPELDPSIKAEARAFHARAKLGSIRADATVSSQNKAFTDQRRQAAMDTPTEAALITEPMMQLAGMNGADIRATQGELAAGHGVGQGAAMASYLRTLNPTVRKELRQARELALAARGSCMLDAENIMSPSPNTLVNLADVMERKFGAFNPNASKEEQLEHAEKIRYYLKQRYQYSVMIHEMGHSIGHRHNFVSSYFAYGFRPQYWQLRTKDGTQTNQCTDVSADGEDCVGPRYFDPPTQDEKDNLVWMWEHSSVMDYPGELAQDLLGLGAYDFAAAQMFYGDTVAVHKDPDGPFVARGARSETILNLTNTFGGIIGYDYIDNAGDPLHYTELQRYLELISDCQTVDPEQFKPLNWDPETLGTWDHLADGLIVQQNGQFTRCRSQKVDYVPYDRMRTADGSELGDANGYGAGGKAFDKAKRQRVPYGFATDSWADLGNLAVYRHDNGADPYELFNFFITEQETRHIFDNYRRERTSFSVRSQAERILGRYNEKMRDGAKGLGLLANIYRSFFPEIGVDFDAAWPLYSSFFFPQNMLASGIAFDHFTKQFARPQAGGHFGYGSWMSPIGTAGLTVPDRVWRSQDSGFSGPGNGQNTDIAVNIHDGATGYFGLVSYGGKLVENRLTDDNGEYDRDYTVNAGSYYDKVYAPYLLTESVDNFISDSLGDFVDPRYRSVSMADLFPDGYRRFLATMLTGDDFMKGPRLAASAGNPAGRANPTVDSEGYPKQGIGFTSWWTPSPEVCWPSDTGIVCTQYGCPSGNVCDTRIEGIGGFVTDVVPTNVNAPASMTVVDPQVGWEQWKWLIANTLLYLPENAKTEWIDLIGLWELGADDDPGFTNRIELHLPDGRVYVARTYGTEEIFGQTVQRGVGARMLEYANDLMRAAYVCTEEFAADGVTSWCIPELNPTTGLAVVRHDPKISEGAATCSAVDNSGCTCSSNRACLALKDYKSLPAFLRQAMRDFRMADASMQGIYE